MSNGHGEDDEYGAERGVIPSEPDLAATDPQARVMRSLAAIGMAFGAAAVVALPFGLIRLHQGDVFGDARVPLFDSPVRGTSLQALWLVFSSLSGAGLAAMLLVGSLGALSFRRWARPLLMLWASGSVAFGAAGTFFFGSWLLPPWRSQWAEARGVVDVLVNFAGWGVGSVLAVAMLCLLTRPRVRAAFEREGQASG